MQYRKIPKTGDRLSVLGHGCMRFVTKDGAVDEELAIAQIHQSIDNGVNYFDTAWPYHGGESEVILGKALQGGHREKVKIATKLPTWLIKSREDMDDFLDKQLENLQTDRIDYYLLHALNGQSWDTLYDLGVLDFVEKALADGKILNIGFSFHGVLKDFKRIIDAYPWIFCQIQYNYLDQEYQAGKEGLEYAASKDIGIIVMEPLRGGNLGLPEAPPAIADMWKSADNKRTPVDWALRWVWNHPQVAVVLSAMNVDEHIKENIAIAEDSTPGCLTKSECELVEKVALKYNELMKVNCTGCGYCLPCPENVSIPVIFEVFNKMHMFGDIGQVKLSYVIRMSGVLTGDPSGYASQCIQCGECLEKCPQNIDIPQFLLETAEDFEDAEMEDRVAMVNKAFASK